MIRYRPFLNTDPPLIVEIWRQQPVIRGQIANLTNAMLEKHVFSKQYFDPRGFIMAIDESSDQPKPLGFVHAGFAPKSDLSELDSSVGIVSQLKVTKSERAEEVGNKLAEKAIEYLQQSGSEVVHAGGQFPLAPFYIGLYGGSRVPGVLEDDTAFLSGLNHIGFDSNEKIIVLGRALDGFRAVIDREQMTLRRQYQIKAIADPLETSWWESCTLGLAERDRFSVSHKLHSNVCASVSFWDMQPFASESGIPTRGMYDLNVTPDLRRCGMATFLVGESLRHLMLQGIRHVEAQTRESDLAALGVFEKIGFEVLTAGHLMTKNL